VGRREEEKKEMDDLKNEELRMMNEEFTERLSNMPNYRLDDLTTQLLTNSPTYLLT